MAFFSRLPRRIAPRNDKLDVLATSYVILEVRVRNLVQIKLPDSIVEIGQRVLFYISFMVN